METQFTHIRENNEDSERHLSENREQYETDAMFLLKLMKFGHRLSRLSVVKDYGIDGRRLGELHSEGKCQKSWKLNSEGKRLLVEYFIPTPHIQSKKECIEKHHKALQSLEKTEKVLHTVFSLEDLPTDNQPYLSQGNLF